VRVRERGDVACTRGEGGCSCRHLGGVPVGVEFMWAVMPADEVGGWATGDPYYAIMSTKSSSEASSTCTLTSASGWGVEDPKMSVTDMRLRVLKGRPVWPCVLTSW
jgi:hypothetical protein